MGCNSQEGRGPPVQTHAFSPPQAFQPQVQTRIHPKARKIITNSNPAFWKFPIHLKVKTKYPNASKCPTPVSSVLCPPSFLHQSPWAPFNQSFLLPCSSPQGLCIYFPTIWNTLLSPLLLTPLLYILTAQLPCHFFREALLDLLNEVKSPAISHSTRGPCSPGPGCNLAFENLIHIYLCN